MRGLRCRLAHSGKALFLWFPLFDESAANQSNLSQPAHPFPQRFCCSELSILSSQTHQNTPSCQTPSQNWQKQLASARRNSCECSCVCFSPRSRLLFCHSILGVCCCGASFLTYFSPTSFCPGVSFDSFDTRLRALLSSRRSTLTSVSYPSLSYIHLRLDLTSLFITTRLSPPSTPFPSHSSLISPPWNTISSHKKSVRATIKEIFSHGAMSTKSKFFFFSIEN